MLTLRPAKRRRRANSDAPEAVGGTPAAPATPTTVPVAPPLPPSLPPVVRMRLLAQCQLIEGRLMDAVPTLPRELCGLVASFFDSKQLPSERRTAQLGVELDVARLEAMARGGEQVEPDIMQLLLSLVAHADAVAARQRSVCPVLQSLASLHPLSVSFATPDAHTQQFSLLTLSHSSSSLDCAPASPCRSRANSPSRPPAASQRIRSSWWRGCRELRPVCCTSSGGRFRLPV